MATVANSTPMASRLLSAESLQRISTIAQAPLRHGHHIRILRDGALAFPAMLAMIRAARRTVSFENFIFAHDATGESFAAALARAHQRGADIRVLYDPVGTWLVRGGSIRRRLLKEQIRARPFRPLSMAAPWSWLHLRHRDHRKLLIVDQLAAVVGGLCIADNWAPVVHGGRGWRDTAVLVRGPAVADLQLAFERMWGRAMGPITEQTTTLLQAQSLTLPPQRGKAKVIVVGDRPRTQRVAALYEYLADTAEHCIEISDAYFVAPERVFRALIRAAQRGVEVRLLVPGRNNHPVAGLAARRIYQPMLEAGARIWEWNGVMLHAKTLVVDGVIAMIGSSNLDPLSLHRNYELNVLVADPHTGATMREVFENDLTQAREVLLAEWRNRPWHHRIAEWAAGLFGWNL